MPADVHGVLSRALLACVLTIAACKGDNGSGSGSGTGTATGTGTGTEGGATTIAAGPTPSALPSLSYDPLPLPPVRDAAAQPVASWVWRTHQGDGFSISLPGEPRITDLPGDEDKVGFTEAKVDVPGGQVSFAAGFSDYPASAVTKPDTFLDERMSTPRRGTTEVVHKRAITLGTSPGRVLIMKRNISGTPLRVYSRLYLVGRRLYSLIVSTLETGGVGEDIVKRFMDSFTLTSKDR